MSTTVSVGGGSETIHGSSAAAIAYAAIMFGDTYTAWSALTADQQKQTLAAAVRFLNAQVWQDDYDTFAKRDAVVAFATAEYELAVLIADDPSVVGQTDTGSNIQSLGAGSASLTFFNPTTRGAALLPPVLMRLIGQYLSASATSTLDGGTGASGNCTNPLSACADYNRREPY